MQKEQKITFMARVACYIMFLSAIACGFLGIMIAGVSVSGGGGGGGGDLIDTLFSLKDTLFIFSAIIAIFSITLPLLEKRENTNISKELMKNIFDFFILIIVFFNFS